MWYGAVFVRFNILKVYIVKKKEKKSDEYVFRSLYGNTFDKVEKQYWKFVVLQIDMYIYRFLLFIFSAGGAIVVAKIFCPYLIGRGKDPS